MKLCSAQLVVNIIGTSTFVKLKIKDYVLKTTISLDSISPNRIFGVNPPKSVTTTPTDTFKGTLGVAGSIAK
jgi:hypothetical protein